MPSNLSSKPAAQPAASKPVSDWPIKDLLDGYREHITTANSLAGVLIGKHGFTKDQLPKLEKVRSTNLVPPELVEKVKLAMAGRTVTANQFDEFLFGNGIRPYSKTGPARKELRTTGVIEVKENAVSTATYLWLAGEKMGVPTGEDMTVPENQ